MIYNNIPEIHWYTIHVIILICGFFTIYATTKTLIKSFYHFNYNKIEIIQRLPIYISINYFCLAFFHSIDHFISLVTYNPIPYIGCRILGFLVDISIYNNCIMLSFIAYGMWKTIIFKNHIEMGIYDWKLLLPSVIFIIIYASIGNYDNNYEYAFCQHKNTLVYYAIPILISYIICIFFWCYLMIYLYLFSKNKIISNNGFVDIESQQNKIKSVIFKIPKFILIYVIEWLPYLTISIYVHYKNLNENVLFGVLLFAIICIMIGGFVFSKTYKKNLPK
jgi:hypothetical protein